MKVYLDTNVILDYLLDSRGAFHEPAVRLMRAVALEEMEAGFSTTQATDLYYSLRKASGDNVARDSLRGLFVLCDLYETPASTCIAALDSAMGDYEDAVQAETARINGCDVIVTRNLDDYREAPVPAMDPLMLMDGR